MDEGIGQVCARSSATIEMRILVILKDIILKKTTQA
jgi:hypothetical protein